MAIESLLRHQGEMPGRIKAVVKQIQDTLDIDARSTICAPGSLNAENEFCGANVMQGIRTVSVCSFSENLQRR
jgi:hypothetical protein